MASSSSSSGGSRSGAGPQSTRRPRTTLLRDWDRGACRWRCLRARTCGRSALGVTALGSVALVSGISAPGAVSRAACKRRAAAACRPAAVRTSTGRTGSRSRVRWSIRALRCLRSLARLISASLTGHGTAHGAPAGGVLSGPLGDVEVEGAHPQQLVLDVQAGAGDHGLLAVAAGGCVFSSAGRVSRRGPPPAAGAAS